MKRLIQAFCISAVIIFLTAHLISVPAYADPQITVLGEFEHCSHYIQVADCLQ